MEGAGEPLMLVAALGAGDLVDGVWMDFYDSADGTGEIFMFGVVRCVDDAPCRAIFFGGSITLKFN